MYSQILFFIVALLLFTMQQPGSQAFLPLLPTLALLATAFALYVAVCHKALGHLVKGMADLPQYLLSLRYHRLQTRLSILALILLAVDVYVLNIKYYLQVIPGFQHSLTIPGVIGLALYLFHLAFVWFWSHPIYQWIHRSTISRGAFVRGHFTFNSAILIPWILISLVFDLLELFKTPAFLNSNTGQFLVSALVMGLFVLFAPRLVVKLWGCDPLPEGMVRADLETFCDQQQFTVGNFLMWPLFGGDTLTAGIMGILPRWRYILITRGLLALLSAEELKAVVAHEMGHVRRYHVLFFLGFFLCYAGLVYSFNDLIILFYLKNDTILRWALTNDTLHLTLFSLLYSIPVLLLLVVYFRYIFGFFLRNSERQADLYALQVIGHPYTLISSLEKIAIYSGHIHDLPSWHHFSIRQRVEFLLESYQNRALIKKHNLKLYGAAFIFLMIVAGGSLAGYELRGAKLTQDWRVEFEANIIEREIQKRPEDAALQAAYGGLLLERGRLDEAESALRKALSLAPNDPTVLNNLAWLYATSPPPHFDSKAALTLASEAAAKDQSPHILDTLAEAYFVNGRFREALDIIEEAISKKPANKDYFLKQKRKFEEALGMNGR